MIAPNGITIREAATADAAHVVELLAHAGLSIEGVLVPGTRYWQAFDGNARLVGVVGLELSDDGVAALLRSAAILTPLRGRGFGAALVERALAAAREAGYRRVYLFSTGAGPFWERHGFYEVPVSELVAALPDAPQVGRFEALGWLPNEVAWRLDL